MLLNDFTPVADNCGRGDSFREGGGIQRGQIGSPVRRRLPAGKSIRPEILRYRPAGPIFAK